MLSFRVPFAPARARGLGPKPARGGANSVAKSINPLHSLARWPRYVTVAASAPRSGRVAATRWLPPSAASSPTCSGCASSWAPRPGGCTCARAASRPARSARRSRVSTGRVSRGVLGFPPGASGKAFCFRRACLARRSAGRRRAVESAKRSPNARSSGARRGPVAFEGQKARLGVFCRGKLPKTLQARYDDAHEGNESGRIRPRIRTSGQCPADRVTFGRASRKQLSARHSAARLPSACRPGFQG